MYPEICIAAILRRRVVPRSQQASHGLREGKMGKRRDRGGRVPGKLLAACEVFGAPGLGRRQFRPLRAKPKRAELRAAAPGVATGGGRGIYFKVP